MCTFNPNFSTAISTSLSRNNTRHNSQIADCSSYDELLQSVERRIGEASWSEESTEKIFESIDESSQSSKPADCVMCVNCFELIELDLVDSHSTQCTESEKNYKNILKRLEELVFLIRDKRLDCKDIYRYPLIVLENIGNSLLSQAGEKLTQELSKSYEKIKAVLQEYEGLYEVAFLAQKLLAILEVLNDSSEPTSAEQISFINTPKSLEKYFYSLCLKEKMLLPLSNPNREKSMFSLYSICLSQDIQPNSYSNFIHNFYSNLNH